MKWHFLQWRMRLDFVSVGGIQLTNLANVVFTGSNMVARSTSAHFIKLLGMASLALQASCTQGSGETDEHPSSLTVHLLNQSYFQRACSVSAL